ncbi:T9SS type A sorting domain-containing protein [Candidatus Bipolaricaulota bacterium]
MNRRLGVLVVTAISAVALFALSAFATDAQMYFSSDKNGQNRVTDIQEGDTIWIVIVDPDENIDCDVRDKIWTDIKMMDPKTGAYIVWVSYMNEDGDSDGNEYADFEVGVWERIYDPYKGHWPGPTAGWLGGDYLEETGADTSVFVSKRSFQVGAREDCSTAVTNTHVVADGLYPDEGWPDDFQWGHYLYVSNADGTDPERGWFYSDNREHRSGRMWWGQAAASMWPYSVACDNMGDMYLVGRFENMDTLIGMYVDPNDDTDVAISMMKIIDVEATLSWDQEIYRDANGAATITVVDPDENVNCNRVEYVPVFILVNPGTWNPVDSIPGGGEGGQSPTNFCMLRRTGGVYGGNASGVNPGDVPDPFLPIRWYSIYHSTANTPCMPKGAGDARYYIEYPVLGDGNVIGFDTVDPDGITPVSFYAQETGPDTGIFQLNLNSILVDLRFNALCVRDVLVAYYLDPNDFDDFKLATAYIEERQHSITSFSDANRTDKDLYWIGRDSVYIQVLDANANVDPCCPEQVVVHICDPHGEDDSEWLVLDETSSNSSVFFSFAGTQLWPVWDALGVGLADSIGGFQLQLDNWKLEAFNEDDVYVRYNDQVYGAPPPGGIGILPLTNDVRNGLATLGDVDAATSFPPWITQTRVANDVSFAWMSIADTQVYDGSTVNMWFLDRQGNRVSGYVNSDCVFIEVVDADQDEDQYRRERIDAYWDGGQNVPFGPVAMVPFECETQRGDPHPANNLLGDVNILNDHPEFPGDQGDIERVDGWPKLYVLNPRSGFWVAVDLLETGVATGDFVSVICIDLTSVYECVPTLGAIPGDTIVAYYQDPSNHSDSAVISVKVGIGGGGTPPSQQSTTMFVDAEGNEIANYTEADQVYVKVIDPSHAGAALLAGALTVEGFAFDLMPLEGAAGSFITEGLDLGLASGETIVAEYTDPTDQTDTSSDTITVIASVLVVDSFYAGPNPFDVEVTFGFTGSGTASTMAVALYDLSGAKMWEAIETDVSEIVWDGASLANGAYLYVITATDGTNTFDGHGKVFIKR